MKKYNLYLWLIALVGLFASCSQDETADALQTANESNRVTLTASLPDDFAQPGTRAIPSPPNGSKLRCILEIWDENLTTLKVRQEAAPGGNANITFTFKLADPGNYKALLWADYIPEATTASPATIAGVANVNHFADKHYTTDGTDGLKAVSIKSHVNSEEADAFFGSKSFQKKATALNDLSATLTRPFTQLTIAEKNNTNLGYCQNLIASYTVPKTLNVADGAVSGTYNVNISIPPQGTEISVNSTPAYILFSDYILTAADGTMGEITMQFNAKSDAGKVLKKITIPAGIPTKRNYRVNAAGNLIQAEDEPSPTTKMTVDIKDTWLLPDENKDIVPVVEAKVGDYFYQDGTWSTTYTNNASNPCIGVIFQVNVDGKSGKIVSLNEGDAMTWVTNGTQYETQATDATDKADGTVNMATIKNLSADYSDFPAFKWCADKNDGDLTWYLPATYELQDLYAASCGLKLVDPGTQAGAGEVERWTTISFNDYSNYASQREAFKQRITDAGGVALGEYWSSKETDATTAGTVECAKYCNATSVYKDASKKVRAIAKFPKP